jgi:hypothetical protein
MKFLVLLFTTLGAALASVPAAAPPPAPAAVDVLIIVGASGESRFGTDFEDAMGDWVQACRAASKSFRIIEPGSAGTNQLAEVIATIATQAELDRELWLILIGHGTFDGREAKFNLAGPDISAKELSARLQAIKRETIVINTSSSSAPFMNELASPSRIVVTATKSGYEENYTRFGKFFAKTIVDREADLDQDGQVSLLEAFLMASRQVEDFYKSEKRLATERALLDDNGDGKGTPFTFYRGVRPAKQPEENAKVDGLRAHQLHFLPSEEEARLSPELRRRRNELEDQLEQLRARKEKLPEVVYLSELEAIILQLSRLYHNAAK